MGLKSLARCGGCAAKASPEIVAALVSALRDDAGSAAEGLLVGLAPPDDASVQRVGAESAIVSTLDAFPPLVDDPDDYGAIAAANAVSDVYAMGGQVLNALLLLAVPRSTPSEVLLAIARAASRVVAECGGRLVGGHTVHVAEPLIGLSVTGVVHPERIWRKQGAMAGDVLVLSKPLGTGLIVTAAEPALLPPAIASMRRTNRAAAASLRAPHAVTDVSGYGLLGHLAEMLRGSGLDFHVRVGAIPVLPGSRELAARGVRTSADASNRRAIDALLDEGSADATDLALLCDPQTSGGLIAAVGSDAVPELVAAGFAVIGEVRDGEERLILSQ